MNRRLAKILLGVLAALVVVVAGAFGAAQTGVGQRWLAAQLESLLAAADGTPAQVEGLSGFLPFDVRLAHFALPDEEGIWLRLEEAHVAWSPGALLRGRLRIDRVTAERLEVVRAPLGGTDQPPASAEEPFQPPSLPTSLPPVELRKLEVGTLRLGEAVLGQAASFHLAGELTVRGEGERMRLDLAATRIDQPTASLDVAVRADLERSILSINVLGEETGGLLRSITDQPEAGDLLVSLAGQGPLDAWVGRFALTAEGLVEADATLRIALTEEPQLGLTGALRPSGALVPAELAPLIGERVNLALQVTQTTAGNLSVEGLRVQAAAFEVDGSARVDADQEHLHAGLQLTVPELAAFEPLAGVPLAGNLKANLSADGPLLQPRGRISLQAFDLAAAGVGGKSLESEITFEVLEPLDTGEPAASLRVTGGLAQLSLGDGVPNPFQQVTWEIDASAPPEGQLRLERLRIQTDVASIEASAAVARADFAGSADLSISAPDLRPITRAYGQEIGGALALELQADLAAHLESIGITADGGLQQLADLPDGLGDVLGQALTLTAVAEVQPAASARLSSLEIAGRAVDLNASGALELASQQLDGTVRLELPRLAALETLAGTNLAGLVTADASLGGTLAAPTVEVKVSGENVAAAGEVLGRVALAADATGLPDAPAGHVKVALDRADLDLTLDAEYRLEGDALSVSALQVDGPGTRVTGDLTVDLARTLIDGALQGRILDLRALTPVTGVALGGEITLDATLVPADGTQRAMIDLAGEDLRGPFGRLDRLQAEGALEDLLGAMTLDVNLGLDRLVVQDDVRFERIAVRTNGSLEALSIETDLRGRAIRELQLESAIDLALGDVIGVGLERLEGTFAGRELRLAGPARATIDGPAIALEGLDLRFAGARLTADADLGPEQSSLSLDLADLPMELLAEFGAPALEGTARAEVRLEGPSSPSQGRFTLAIEGLRPVDTATLVDAPPTDLDLEGTLTGSRLQTTLAVVGLTAKPVSAEAEIPFQLALAPFDLQLPEDGPISGRLDVEAELARIAAIIGLDDQRLEGVLTAALDIDGTLGAPAVTGAVELADGIYENGETGTVLREIVATILVREERIEVERFTANDGGDGRLRIDGGVTLAESLPTDVDLSLALEQATLVRRDDATGTISGNIDVAGALAERLNVVGRLTVDRATISIEENPGPSIASLDVEEVGRDAPSPEEDEGRTAPPVEIGLDVTIDIPGRVFVRGRGLESEWQGQLAVTGTAEEPRLTGYLEISRGRFDFVDKRFSIDRGRIDFTGSIPPDPTLDLQASSQGANIKGIIELSGPATDPQLSLSSEPPLPEDEVLAQLLFDRPVDELGPGDAIALAQTVSALRGGKSRFDLLGGARKALGVDTLEVGTGEDPSDVNVRAGKYLTDDIYVEVERGGAEDSGKASVEIEVLPDLVPNLAVEAETTREAAGGVGVKWHFDY